MNVSTRNKAITKGYLGGLTLKELGQKYKLTPERVRQILTHNGPGTRAPGPRPDPNRVRRRPRTLHDRFFAHVETISDADGRVHWVWRRVAANGYGSFRLGGALQYAHRAAFSMIRGRNPLRLKKLCTVRGCVNPSCWSEVSRGKALEPESALP